jgi:glycosyltransferase involved in cell wall biosynthesis
VDRSQEYRLMIVGDGDLLEKEGQEGLLVSLCRELHLEDFIVFTGGIPYAEVPEHVAAADLCLALFPVNVITMSKSPLKVYEYLAAGKPVAARDVGEISGCVRDGWNGILMHSDSSDEYADRIDSLFQQGDGLAFLAANARKTVEDEFSWQRSALTVAQACADVLSRVKGRSCA